MTANPSHWSVTFEDYLHYEEEAERKHELIDGEIVAMAGASTRHNRLCERLRDRIRPALGDGPCFIEGSDMRLAIMTEERGSVAYYPDLSTYGSNVFHPFDKNSRLNPTLLVEVTSRSTEKKDRGVKLRDYREIATLEEYLIVSHKQQEIEYWHRGGDGWTKSLVTAGELRLRSGATIDLERLYVDLPE